MNKRRWVIALALLALTGCSKPVWYKPGATQADFLAAKKACEAVVNDELRFKASVVGQVEGQEYLNKCMNEYGWTLKDQS